MTRLAALARSFHCAWHGICAALRQERNLRIHLCAVVFVVMFGVWQDLSAGHWAIQLLCCALVVSLELINSALEALCDAFCTDQHPAVRYAKDVSAGAVLVCAATSAVIWFVFLLSSEQYPSNLCAAFQETIWPVMILAVWAVCSILFVFVPEKTKEGKG